MILTGLGVLNFLEPLELFNFLPKIHPEMRNLEIIYVEDERVGDRRWGRCHYFRVHVGNYRPGRHGVGSAEFFDFSWTCPCSPRKHHPFLGPISGHQIRFSPQFDLHCWPQSGLCDLHWSLSSRNSARWSSLPSPPSRCYPDAARDGSNLLSVRYFILLKELFYNEHS